MLFSVIVPIYNVEKYLDRCILSILNQTLVDFELILVNDGSTDNSLKICQKYLNINKVKIINKKNKGLSSAKNAGLKISKGDYVLFVDGDDYIIKDCLHIINENLKSCSYDSICFNYISTSINEKKNVTLIKTKTSLNISDKFNFIYNILLKYKIGWESWSRVYRNDVIKSHNLSFNEDIKFAEDLCFSLVYYSVINNAIALPNYLYCYTSDRQESIMNTIGKTIYFNDINCISKYYFNFAKEKGINSVIDNYYLIHYLLFKNEIEKISLHHNSFISIKKLIFKNVDDLIFFKKQCRLFVKNYWHSSLNDRKYFIMFRCLSNKFFAMIYFCYSYLKKLFIFIK